MLWAAFWNAVYFMIAVINPVDVECCRKKSFVCKQWLPDWNADTSCILVAMMPRVCKTTCYVWLSILLIQYFRLNCWLHLSLSRKSATF